MKKYSWILALLLALSFAFVSCPDGEKKDKEEPEGEWVTVWEMAADANIQALDGLIANTTPNPLAPLVRAGGDTDVIITALKVEGSSTVSLEVETGANWGAGFDLRHEAFGFQAGDKITVTGELLSAGYTQLNFTIGSEDAKGFKKDSEGAFTWNIELTAGWVAVFKNTTPAGIRFEGRGSGVTFRVDNIKIEGNRPSTLTKLAAPVVTVTDVGVEWVEIEGASGYDIYADGEKVGTTTLTRFGLRSLSALEPGEHSIQVVALGTTGSTSDSDKSAAVIYDKPAPVVSSAEITILDEDAYWDYKADDAVPNPNGLSLKGNLNSEVSAQILSYTLGEVWLYWEYVGDDPDATRNGWGIGTFGGTTITAAGGPRGGVTKMAIADLNPSAQPTYVPDDQLYLNVYNACAVYKIEVYSGVPATITILDEDAYWDYKADDAVPNPNGLSLKGNLNSDVSAQILSYTLGEVWLYWEYVGDDPDATRDGWGIGTFGGTTITAAGGPRGGVTKMAIADLNPSAQPTYVPDDQLYLNVYNACAVVKIEVYE